jgi:phenylacetate-CoA ligase
MVYLHGREPDSDTISIRSSLEDQIAFIEERRKVAGVQAITTYPTSAEFLSEHVLERNIDMSYITRFGLFGETVEERHRQILRRAFPHAEIWVTYSAMEFGIIGFLCPFDKRHYHLFGNRFGVEVLRDDNTPAAVGEVGRVVITDYFNDRCPLIRYELGDYVVREPCPCGRIKLPGLSAIHGKVRGALLHRDGSRVFFADLDVGLRDLPGMKRYQIVQHSIEHFTVQVVSEKPLNGEISQAFRSHFGYVPQQLAVTYVDNIPLGPNGKFFATISEV